jgi:Ca2+-binding RTX toxin-like protein
MRRRVVLVLAATALTLLLASGVAWALNKVGTNGPDTLRGTHGDDNLVGLGGNDELFAQRGNDNLLGGPGKDVVTAETERGRSYGGKKNMVGGTGNDFVFGGKGSDNVVGGRGNDYLIDGYEANPKKDAISGGPGNDVFWSWNNPAGKDVLTCGSGVDRVFADRNDLAAPDCEKVFIGIGSFDESSDAFEAWMESIPESFWEGLP